MTPENALDLGNPTGGSKKIEGEAAKTGRVVFSP